MNISPAERAAEFEGPASQPPLGTRQFATKSLDWTILVQRMDGYPLACYAKSRFSVRFDRENSTESRLPALSSSPLFRM